MKQLSEFHVLEWVLRICCITYIGYHHTAYEFRKFVLEKTKYMNYNPPKSALMFSCPLSVIIII